MALFSSTVSLLIPCLLDLSMTGRRVLKSPNVIAVFSFSLPSDLCLASCTLLGSGQMHILQDCFIVLESSSLSHCVMLRLSVIIFLVLKSGIRVGTPAFSDQYQCGIAFSIPLLFICVFIFKVGSCRQEVVESCLSLRQYLFFNWCIYTIHIEGDYNIAGLISIMFVPVCYLLPMFLFSIFSSFLPYLILCDSILSPLLAYQLDFFKKLFQLSPIPQCTFSMHLSPLSITLYPFLVP